MPNQKWMKAAERTDGMKKKKRRYLTIALLIALIIAFFGAAAYLSGAAKEWKDGRSAEDVSDADEDARDGEGSGQDGGEASGEDAGPEGGPLATLFFASDYQAEQGFDAPADTLRGILAAAKTDGKQITQAVMCGDYSNDRKLHDYQISPDDAIDEIREIIEDEYPDRAKTRSETESAVGKGGGSEAGDTEDRAGEGTGTAAGEGTGTAAGEGTGTDAGIGMEDTLFVQGNHDMMTGKITPTGLYEYDNYLIYVLNTEEDFPWKQGKTSGALAKVRKSAAAMKDCFDKLIENGETRPVFIAGHVPLHFTARTSSRHTTGDNLYSSLIFDVVNDAARSLDIVYLFGHDHSKGWDCYLGGSSVYKTKGDTILIPRFREDRRDSDEYSEETLGFTYLNAGYVGYYMNCGPDEHEAGKINEYRAADETLTGTVFEIYTDRIVVTRYDSEGPHVLSHAGKADPYKGGIDAGLIDEEAYSREIKSPQTLALQGNA